MAVAGGGADAAPYPNRFEQVGAPLFILDVDVGGGRKECITVCEGGVAEAVAAAFVAHHGLPPAVVGKLAGLIRKNQEGFVGAKQ